ncbi:hypothetical protein QQP08_023438 [Theobroma cacao]|nr:hypothetical protein QQP08_023438 [Theobroma cacao]
MTPTIIQQLKFSDVAGGIAAVAPKSTGRSQGTSKEEPVQSGVVSKRTEDPFWSNQTPDNRCIIEDSVTRTCPGTVGRNYDADRKSES